MFIFSVTKSTLCQTLKVDFTLSDKTEKRVRREVKVNSILLEVQKRFF